MSKKVLITATSYYTSTFQVGSHHYARAFEELGYEVLFISAPISPLHKLFYKFFSKSDSELTDLRERERIYKKGGERMGNIIYYVPFALFTPHNKPFLSSKFVMDNWYKFTIPNILNYIEEQEFYNIDILWLDNSLFWFLLDKLAYKKSILRLTDYSKGFNALPDKYFKKELEIANRVDKVGYTAKNLKGKYLEIKDKSKMLYVPNGINFSFFEGADKSCPKEFRGVPKPRIIYIGAIRHWFDVDVVYYCAKSLPDYSFIIIGPEQRDLSKLKRLNNVYLLGSKPYKTIPRFLYNSDVGIIPFDVKNYPELINSVSPLKLYEYMACGLPVVSVEWEELKDINSPAFLSKTKEDFLDDLKKALQVSNKEKEEFKNFAKGNDWRDRIKKLVL